MRCSIGTGRRISRLCRGPGRTEHRGVKISCSERAENFRRLFEVVDTAMANGNNEQLAMALHGITELARTTPFRELVDINRTRELLSTPGHEWKF
jgi:hypothetical protein